MAPRHAGLKIRCTMKILGISGLDNSVRFKRDRNPDLDARELRICQGLDSAAALVVDGEFDKNFQLSARNLADVALLPVAGINVYDIMKSDKLVLTTAAVKAIEARLG